ncbi:MAG: radical SAM protein [Calditrichaceae bacterium]
MVAFGPVPSRRLGTSLGVKNLPFNICTYSCTYCQIGKLKRRKSRRCSFFSPQDIFADIQDLITKIKEQNDTIDYLTFVPNGEPTLDQNLGKILDLVRFFNIKLAVITNGSLLYNAEVRADLCKADRVSIKIDSVDEKIWKRLNRPHHQLKLQTILQGQQRFADDFKGCLNTETMLVEGINTSDTSIQKTADFIAGLKPSIAYISVPIRPPAENNVSPPTEETVNRIYHIFKERINSVQCLLGHEGNSFGITGNAEEDLLNILAVHPMRFDALIKFLQKSNLDWSIIENLLERKQIVAIQYKGSPFYLRRIEKNIRAGYSQS